VYPDSMSTTEGASNSKEIRIEQLRGLSDWLHTTTHAGGWRVVVIYPTEALNPVSANALLKVLEEPPANTVFLLVGTALDQLLPTIVSRCRRLPLPLPDKQEAIAWLTEQGITAPEAWLAAASGGPLTAVQLAQQQDQPYPSWLHALVTELVHAKHRSAYVAPIASEIEKLDAADWIMTLQRLFIDFNLVKHGQQPRYYPELPGVDTVAKSSCVDRLAQMSKWLVAQQRVARHPLNAQLRCHQVLHKAVRACLSN